MRWFDSGRGHLSIVGALRDVLTEYKARHRRGRGIVFGSREGTLMPASEVEAAALIDSYLARADISSRIAQLNG